MTATFALSIIVGLCISFGMLLFTRAVPARVRRSGGPFASFFVMLITVFMLLIGSWPMLLLMTLILWVSGWIFPGLVDHGHLWSLFCFALFSLVLLTFYELLVEPFLKVFLHQLGISAAWIALPQLAATIFVMLLISATLEKEVILSPAGTLFVAAATVTFHYYAKRALPAKKRT